MVSGGDWFGVGAIWRCKLLGKVNSRENEYEAVRLYGAPERRYTRIPTTPIHSYHDTLCLGYVT